MNNNNLFTAVMELDLEPIKAKLMHVESGEGWSLDRANATEKEYRRFLCLMKMYPDEDTAPLVDVDTFWHYHILDTMKYAADCQQAFGYFVHHYPYVGMQGEDDEQSRLDSGQRTRVLYAHLFGAAAAQQAADSGERIDSADRAVSECGKAATAWCASPGDKRTVQASDAAWCASPGAKPGALSGNTAAWCASPGAKASDTAWCASPGDKAGALGGDQATWCASPGAKHMTAVNGSATAWCASPGAKDAVAAS